MGCDIHLHLEIKVDGVWQHYSAPRIKRDYDLFARMANVRNGLDEIEPISQPRGLPSDISVVTALDLGRMKEDAHSASWLSAEELEKLVEWYDNYRKTQGWFSWEHSGLGYCFGQGWHPPTRFARLYPDKVEDVRAVFWFDC